MNTAMCLEKITWQLWFVRVRLVYKENRLFSSSRREKISPELRTLQENRRGDESSQEVLLKQQNQEMVSVSMRGDERDSSKDSGKANKTALAGS